MQHVVVDLKLGGIDSHEEYEELRMADTRGETAFVSKGQEAHNKNTKAFRYRAREIRMAFFAADSRDPKIKHVKASVFGISDGQPLLAEDDPVLALALSLAPPVVEGMGPPDLYAR